MKMKKFWKRFWTMNRHHAGGFTLVELIVVIAILAILGGVAVPAYSGYVKKANMQADISLISDIEHALILAGYSGTFGNEIGSIVLSASEAYDSTDAVAGSNLDKALEATFGTGYSLQLKYDGWTSDASMLAWLLGSDNGVPNNSYENVSKVANSSFLTGDTTEELMNNVENLTTKLAGIVENMGEAGKDAVYNMFDTRDGSGNTSNALQTVMDDFGYTSLDNVDATTLSNLVVLAAAEEMKTLDSAAQMGGATPSDMSNFVTYYALYTAYAASERSSQAYKDKYAELQQYIQDNDDPTNIAIMIDSFAVNITGNDSIPADSGWAEYSGGNNPIGSEYFKDVDAFANIMNAVDNANISSSDLSDGTLFTQGTVNTLFGSYVGAVDSLSKMTEEEYNNLVAAAGNGGVSVVYSCDGNVIKVSTSLPELG